MTVSMNKLEQQKIEKQLPDDPTAVSRKRDHIEMAFRSQVDKATVDTRFHYEPLLAAHPKAGSYPSMSFLNKSMRTPMWVSSMTGGTDWAKTINHNLARACKDFGMGMGLGSCRALLHGDEMLKDFDVRKLMGDDLPLYANLGVAQIEQVIDNDELYRVGDLVDKLSADGLIIHINPLQEWLQPEGDRFQRAPLETIETVLNKYDFPIIVKEVGQGFGYESLKKLYQMPIAAVDFAANGGTNFAKLEMLRSDQAKRDIYSQLANVGHSAEDMVEMSNQLFEELGDKAICKDVIISGGVKNFLDGYYLVNKLEANAVYGMASAFLEHAREDYDTLYKYVDSQVRGLELANAFLKVR